MWRLISKKKFALQLVVLAAFPVLFMSSLISVYGLPNTWTSMANTPGLLWYEVGTVWTGADDIYMSAGMAGTGFYKYSISGNSWTTLASNPTFGPGDGQDLVWTGGDYIYKLNGYTSAIGVSACEFWRYSISGDSWSTKGQLAYLPEDPFHPALVWGGGDYLYALGAGITNPFVRYSISGNSWTARASPPGAQGGGCSMAWSGGDYIYALQGVQSNGFWRYSISGDSWTTLTNVPKGIWWAGSLAYDGSNYIYAWGGWNGVDMTNDFWRYSISGNSWETLANSPNPAEGGGLCYANGYVYGVRGATAGTDLHNDFWRYELPAAPSAPPEIESCDNAGTKKDTFLTGETVYVKGSGFVVPGATFALYVVSDVTWIEGMSIPSRIAGTVTTVTSDVAGNIPVTMVWSPPLTLGKYDIVVDVNGNGKYDAGVDALDDNDIVTGGFLVIPEYLLGTILGLSGCFAALGTCYFSKRRRFNP
jgi:hypothetical protein